MNKPPPPPPLQKKNYNRCEITASEIAFYKNRSDNWLTYRPYAFRVHEKTVIFLKASASLFIWPHKILHSQSLLEFRSNCSLCLSVSISVSIYLSLSLSVCLSVCLSVSLSLSLSLCCVVKILINLLKIRMSL